MSLHKILSHKYTRYGFWTACVVVVGIGLASFSVEGTKLVYEKAHLEKHGAVLYKNIDSYSSIERPEKPTSISKKNLVKEQIVVGKPWGTVEGLTMFRGNPTRTWYGTGPLPENPSVLWRYPKKAMCSLSTVAYVATTWCGTGWTGQPVVWERSDGITEIIFGAYDRHVHFVNAETGEDTRPPFPTGDIIKGSVTLDPNGYPLLYFGSRDNKLRIVSLDRNVPTELWALDANTLPGIWNNDWDGNPAIVDGILYEGGENGWFFAISLNRHMDENGLVSVSPNIIFTMPGYTDELVAKVGENVSIENSLAFFDDRVYFANSGGRIIGLDLSNIHQGIAPIVFDYWAGDDIDATIVIDKEGMLYVSAELEKFRSRSHELGQLMKLDPYNNENPLVWGMEILPERNGEKGGIWATPALKDNYLYVATQSGRLMVVEKTSGTIEWEEYIGSHAWSSPVVVEDSLLVTTCTGKIRAYTLTNEGKIPQLDWDFSPAGETCIESTPAVWKGNIYVGSRDGYFYAVGESNDKTKETFISSQY